MGFVIGIDVMIISLKVALSLWNSEDENRLWTPLASVVLVCISQGQFFLTTRDFSTLSPSLVCQGGSQALVWRKEKCYIRILSRIFFRLPSFSCTFWASLSLAVFIVIDFPLISSLNRSLIIISWSLLLECFLIYSGNGGVFWSQDGVLTVSQITSNQVFVGDLDFFCNCCYLIAVEYGPSNTPGFLLLNYCHCCCYVWLNLSFQVLHHLFPVCYKICSLWCKIGDEL